MTWTWSTPSRSRAAARKASTTSSTDVAARIASDRTRSLDGMASGPVIAGWRLLLLAVAGAGVVGAELVETLVRGRPARVGARRLLLRRRAAAATCGPGARARPGR